MSEAPRRVWLLTSNCDAHVTALPNKDGVEYVRADIYESEVTRLREALEKMPCRCDKPFFVDTNLLCQRCRAINRETTDG